MHEVVDALPQFVHALRRVQINVLLLDGAPETLYPDIVLVPAASVHADLYFVAAKQIEPSLRGELTALVGVYNLRRAVPLHGLTKQFVAVWFMGCCSHSVATRRQGVAQPPADDEAAVHVDDGVKVHKSVFHRDVGDVDAPHLVACVISSPRNRYGCL